MTEPTDATSEDKAAASESQATPAGAADAASSKAAAESEGKAGKALAKAGSSPVNPFLATAEEEVAKAEAPLAARSFASRLLDYSAHAAIIVGLIGFAWTVSSHVVNRPDAPRPDAPRPVAASAPNSDDLAQLRQANLKMHEEIKALKANVDAMRTAVRRDTTPEQVRMLAAGLESVRGNLGTIKTETSAAIMQLTGKVDRLQPGKVRELTDRVGRLEHQTTDQTATGSISKPEPRHADVGRDDSDKAVRPQPPAKPTTLAKVEDHDAKSHDAKSEDQPQTISGIVVRDVYRGVALVEGRHGTMEVVPGMTIPGAGVVKSIERRNGNWTVLTSKGEIAYAAEQPHDRRPTPPTPYGYGRGGGYAPYRYGY